MTDIAAALAGAGPGTGTGTGAGEGDGGTGAGTVEGDAGTPLHPAWMNGLGEEFRNDPDLNRYPTLEDFAKGAKETRAWARGRVPIPQDETGYRELGDKLRPAEAKDYEIPLPEGDTGAMADRFRTFAHDTGLPAPWAKAVAEFHNREQADALSKMGQTAKDELTAIELEYGAEGYNARLEAVSNLFRTVGIEGFEPANSLQQARGAGETMKFLFAMAEKTGELGKVDPHNVSLRLGSTTPQAAQAWIDQKMNDRAFMAQARIEGTNEYRQWKEHNLLASQPAKRA